MFSTVEYETGVIKFWHLRAVEAVGQPFLPTGGLTVAYIVNTSENEILVHFAKCRESLIVDDKLRLKRNRAIDKVLLDFKLGNRRDVAKLQDVREALHRLGKWRIHTCERFCYKTGRTVARTELETEGPADVLPLAHPISATIAEWVATVLWPSGTEAAHYIGDDMGYPIDIWTDKKGRYVSDFLPYYPGNV